MIDNATKFFSIDEHLPESPLEEYEQAYLLGMLLPQKEQASYDRRPAICTIPDAAMRAVRKAD